MNLKIINRLQKQESWIGKPGIGPQNKNPEPKNQKSDPKNLNPQSKNQKSNPKDKNPKSENQKSETKN